MNPLDELSLNPRLDITLALQLKQQITWMIASGKLKPGDQLPPVKALAARLGINLHTVRGAYLKLAAEGLLETRQGRGTHVLPFDPASLAQISGAARSHTVGVIVPSWTNPFYHGLLTGIEEIAEEDGTLFFLCNSHDDQATAWRGFARLAAKQVDGILVVSQAACPDPPPLPVVSVDWPACAGYGVQIDLQQAGCLAVQHLVEHGHRRIGLITFAVEAENVTPVNRGYQQALAEHGLPIDPALIARVPGFDMLSGAQGARKLLSLPEPPTAIFAIADLLALGALQACKQARLRVPEDLALVGFNDIPSAALVSPSLTTVAAPAVQAGREAMRMLQFLIAGEQPPQREMLLSTTLVVRESCGCPRKEG